MEQHKDKPGRFIDWFVARGHVKEKSFGEEFVKMSTDKRLSKLSELAEEFGVDPESIDVSGLAQIEAENFQVFIEKAQEKTKPESPGQPPSFPSTKDGL